MFATGVGLRVIAGVLALAAGGVGAGVAGGRLLAHDAQGGLRHLQIFVEPHPDDGLAAIASLSDDPSTYTVFVTMTHGERTSNCASYRKTAQVEFGEALPTPTPDGGVGSWTCNWAVLNSWTEFWWTAADGDPAIPKVRGHQQKLTFSDLPALAAPINRNYGADGKYQPAGDGEQRDATAFVHVGEQAAQVAFNAGDGNLTADEVEWGVRSVLDLRGDQLPNVPLVQVIAGAYDSAGDSRAFQYEHPDNRAVAEGVRAVAHLAQRGSLLVTTPFDPDANEKHTLSNDRYDALLGLGRRQSEARDSYRRQGAAQVYYGWLAYPRSYWATGEKALAAGDVVFPRTQYFVRVR